MNNISINFRRTLLGILSLLPFFSSNVFPLDLTALFEKLPHVTLPFTLSEKGHVLTTDFKAGGNLNKTYLYNFRLSFLITDDEFKSGRIAGLLGYGQQRFGFFRGGIPIPLRLTISRLVDGNEMVVYNEEVQHLLIGGAGNSRFFKDIDSVRLEPALYRVRLETLAAVPELADVPVNFEIGLPGKH